jgi:TldD protein
MLAHLGSMLEAYMTAPMIDHDVLADALDHALRNGGDFAEVFVEDRRSSSGRFDDGRIEELVSGRDRGAGLRVVRGDTTGFAHTADLTREGLRQAADAAAGAARGGGGGSHAVALEAPSTHPMDPGVVLPETVEKRRKVELLARADASARAAGSAVTSVTASYADARRRILVANSDGLLADDDRVRTRMSVQCVATGDTGMQTGYEAPGRTMGFELFDTFVPEDIGERAAHRALALLDAVPAPSGRFPVVLKRGAGGVLFHEACGHGLEADHIFKDASVFKGQMGTAVASPLVTLVDDGGYAHEWGTLAIDDEGHPAQRNVLIENGVLTDYMWDVVRARKEGRVPSGNGRRESYRCLPMPRMTNTFLLEGATDPDDIVRSVDFGIYCVQLGGGQVDPATGDFVFGVTEAYLIENGEITRPIRAAQLIGNGPEVLRMVDAVGNDFDTWTGMCGKQGQSVPVSSGQPTVLVREMTVGGTAA